MNGIHEYEAARVWRERNGLTTEQLAGLIGYTKISIYWFERGTTPPNRNAASGNPSDRRIKPWVWQRFKRACGDLDAELHGRRKGKVFDW